MVAFGRVGIAKSGSGAAPPVVEAPTLIPKPSSARCLRPVAAAAGVAKIAWTAKQFEGLRGAPRALGLGPAIKGQEAQAKAGPRLLDVVRPELLLVQPVLGRR